MKTILLYTLLNPDEILPIKEFTTVRNSKVGDLTYSELNEMNPYLKTSHRPLDNAAINAIFTLSLRYKKRYEKTF